MPDDLNPLQDILYDSPCHHSYSPPKAPADLWFLSSAERVCAVIIEDTAGSIA